MKELVGMIVRTLVNSPEEVEIKEIEVGSNTRILEIKVSKQDVRKLLRNISALRRIVSAAGKGKSYYTIDVVSENGWGSKRWSSKGKIRRLIEDRNYGIIEAEDGRTIYFHGSSLQGIGIRSLSLYQPVYFEAVERPTGLRAIRVVPMTEQGLWNLQAIFKDRSYDSRILEFKGETVRWEVLSPKIILGFIHSDNSVQD